MMPVPASLGKALQVRRHRQSDRIRKGSYGTVRPVAVVWIRPHGCFVPSPLFGGGGGEGNLLAGNRGALEDLRR